MEMVRFYAQDAGIELLAKYVRKESRGTEDLKGLCAPIMDGMAEAPDPYDIINKRLAELDLRLCDAGFERIPPIDADDTETRCDRAYDVLLNPEEKSTTMLVWSIKQTGDRETPYEKKLEDKLVIEKLV